MQNFTIDSSVSSSFFLNDDLGPPDDINYNGDPPFQTSENREIMPPCDSHQTIPSKKAKQQKAKFTPSEDQLILNFVKENGPHMWGRLSQSLLPERTPRQIRERWVNYLCPNVSHEPFTEEEDRKILDLVERFGKRWSVISQNFDDRTDVQIKNRHALLMRHQRNAQKKLQFEAQKQQQYQEKELFLFEQDPFCDNEDNNQRQQLYQNDMEASYNENDAFHAQHNDDTPYVDPITDTEIFPILEDFAECNSEWDLNSYQYDDPMSVYEY